MLKFVFLDIDGPLNTGRNDFLNPERFGHHFDDEAVQNLREVLNSTEADIVISSSWRHLGSERLDQLWKEWGLPGRIVGCTPDFWGDDRHFKTRGEEIEQWLKDNTSESSSYVVIDDMGTEEATDKQIRRWITVDPRCGITKEDAAKAIRLLNDTKDKTSECVPSAFPQLDALIGGWKGGELIVIASRPSLGNTAMGLTLVRHTAVGQQAPVAYFSLEMSEVVLEQRLNLCSKEGEMQTLREKVIIDDTPALSIRDFSERAEKFVTERGVRLIVVDYLQLMNGRETLTIPKKPFSKKEYLHELSDDRGKEVLHILQRLKNTAKELNIPIIVLSQLSRAAVRHRKPLLSDFRPEEIAQKADVVLLLKRDLLSEDVGNARLILAKNPDGTTGDIPVRFIPLKACFEEVTI